jgi:hypothetical protein
MYPATVGYLIIGLVMGLFIIGTTCLIVDCVINKETNIHYSQPKNNRPRMAETHSINNSLDTYLDFDEDLSYEQESHLS